VSSESTVETAVKQSSTCQDVNTKAEESTLWVAVTQQWIVKTKYEDVLCGIVRSRVRQLATAL
jgi:hypothetical protein